MAIAVASLNMKALVAHGPGSPTGLRVEEVERPVVADDGVLVRVRATSVNPVDLYAVTPVAHIQRGLKPARVGTDFAGVVEEVGKSVTAFRPGDEVFGAARGAFAELVSVSEGAGIVHKPSGVTFEDAGTLAVAGSTALQALRDRGRVECGQKVLINGASGGVGTFAVQVAKALGAEVTAVCSTRHVDVVRSLGASRLIDYTREDFSLAEERYDLMLDVAGNHPWADCKRVLRRGATYVGVGAAGVQHGKGGAWRALGHFLQVRVASTGAGLHVVALFIAKLNKPDLAFLGELVESGRVRPVIERRYALEQIAEALTYLNQGHAGGKITIRVGE